MNNLAFSIKECNMINYADDTKIHKSDENLAVVEAQINQDLMNTNTWFKENGMRPNTEKYQATILGPNKGELNLNCGNTNIDTSESITLLGITIDQKLKFDIHASNICRKVGRQVNVLNRLKNTLPIKMKEMCYLAFILPHFQYCNKSWHHCGQQNTEK